jgi:CBS domain containing-hemolysin-like protein
MISTQALIALLVACGLGVLFSVTAEVALSACDRAALRARGGAGNKRAQLVERMLNAPQITLATTLVGAHLAGLGAVLVVACELIAGGASPLWAPVIVVPPLLVLGHLVPKIVVVAHADRIVDPIARPLAMVSYLLRPAIVVVGAYAAALTRLTGSDRRKAFVTRDELALLIESDPESDKPEISADEREMIANVFELSEKRVGELMVPLSEVTALPEDASVLEAAREVADKQHSRMPIYRSRVDDVVGIVHVFDLLQAASDATTAAALAAAPASVGSGAPLTPTPVPGSLVAALAPAATLAGLAHPANYVPETMRASDLLVQLQSEGQHLAIVVDEYGGAVGIVTMEDLLEIIVGDIDDEYDHQPSPIRAERPGVWRVEARTAVARVNVELGLGLPESDDYETIAGLLIERFRRIPDPGESIQLGAITVEVVAATDRAVETVRLSRRKK